MNRIGLLCCVWDSPREVMRMLEQDTIEDFDFIGFWDGKFSNWRGEPEWDRHEIQKIVMDWNSTHKKKIYYTRVEDKTEAEKRNHMFFEAYRLGVNWGFVCDADEIPFIDRKEWDIEKESLQLGEWGCYSVILNNYNLIQRRPRLFNMREQPYLIQHPENTSHNHIYSSFDGRDMAVDITECQYDVKSLKLTHDKEFYSKYRFECRNEFAKVHNH